jgi:hypothetical protein
MLAVIAAMLVSSVLMYTAEAKTKKSTIKVYIFHIVKNPWLKEKAKVCMSDDDGCFGKTKTVDLQKATKNFKESRILVSTYHLAFSTNPDDEFGPSDVSACGRLIVKGLIANDCAYGDLEKTGKKSYRALIDFDDLEHNFANG